MSWKEFGNNRHQFCLIPFNISIAGKRKVKCRFAVKYVAVYTANYSTQFALAGTAGVN